MTKEQPKPKFKVGDKVRVLENAELINNRGKIATIIKQGECCKGYGWVLDISRSVFLESELELYTEENKETMEEKELNLAELLKGCEGERVFNPAYGEVTLKEIRDVVIVFETSEGGLLTPPMIYQLHTGFIPYYPSEESFLKYPLDAYTAWMEWKEARKPKRWRATKGEEFWQLDEAFRPYRDIELNVTIDNLHYESGNYFRTEKEALQAAEIVKEALQKFHEKKMNKTWKKK